MLLDISLLAYVKLDWGCTKDNTWANYSQALIIFLFLAFPDAQFCNDLEST